MISQSRFNSRFAGLNSIAKKVFAATPISEAWGVHQICTELVRLGTPMETRVVHGSLAAMSDMGLVKETTKNCFVREQVRAVAVKETTPSSTAMEIAMTKATTLKLPETKPAPAKKAAPTMDQLNDLVQRMGQLSHEMQQLAEDVAEAILVQQVQQEADAAELAQLRQLKALLKGLGMGAV